MDPINNHSQEFTIPSNTNVNLNENFFKRIWHNFVNLLYWPSSPSLTQNRSANERTAIPSTPVITFKNLQKEKKIAWHIFSNLTSDEAIENFYEKLRHLKIESTFLKCLKKLVTALHDKNYKRAAHIYKVVFFKANKSAALSNKFLLRKLKNDLRREIHSKN